MFDNIEALEKEIDSFHKNIANSNELIETLRGVTSAIRELNTSHSSILERAEESIQAVPDKMIQDNQRQQSELLSTIERNNEAAKEAVKREYSEYSKKISAYNKEASALIAGLNGLTNQLSNIKTEITDEYQNSNTAFRNELIERISSFTASSDNNVAQLIKLQNDILSSLADDKSSIDSISLQFNNAQKRIAEIEKLMEANFSTENEKRLAKIESELKQNSKAITELNERSENMMKGIEKGNKAARIAFIILGILLAAIILLIVGFKPKNEDVNRANIGMSQVLNGGIDSINVSTDIDIPENYIGELKNNLPNGKGTYDFSDGTTYTGQWEEGVVNGEGIFITSEFKLEGLFSDNRLITGTDIVFNDNGEVTFNISDGVVDYSNVTVIFNDNTKYTGEWNEGINGKGNVEFSNGDKYSGIVQLGKFNDSGIYTWKNGSSYDGEWTEGMMNGTGTYYYSSDKSRYLKGSFENNIPTGQLKYYYKSHEYTTVWNDGQCSEITY